MALRQCRSGHFKRPSGANAVYSCVLRMRAPFLRKLQGLLSAPYLSRNICISLYIYNYIYIYVFMYVFIYIYIYIHIYVLGFCDLYMYKHDTLHGSGPAPRDHVRYATYACFVDVDVAVSLSLPRERHHQIANSFFNRGL